MSLNYNFLVVAGRVTADVELKSSPGGTSVAEISVAVNRYRNGVQSTDFIPVVVFGKTAEMCARNLRKGSSVFFSGELRQDNWQGSDGKKHYKLRMYAAEARFFEFERLDGANNGQPPLKVDAPSPAPASVPAPSPYPPQWPQTPPTCADGSNTY